MTPFESHFYLLCLCLQVSDVTYCIFVSRSLIFMGLLTIVGTGFGAYIMAMAALSPCPLLVHSASGTAIIVRPFLSLK